MASSKIKGITVEIGGDTSKLGKALENTEKQSRSLQGELKQVEKLLKMDPGNTELLAQKQKLLTEAVSETTEKLRILENAERQVIEQFERGDIGEDQLRAFQREIIKTRSELDGFNAKLNDTEGDLKKVGDSAEDSGDGFTVMKGALADLVADAIASALSAIGDLVGALFELSEATEEYRTMQAKLEGSADTFGYSMEYATGKYQEFYKYLGDDQMATNAITNLMGLGTSTESVTKLAEGAISVWSAYGDSIPIEGLTEALNETAQVGKVTGSLADALNWAGISEDAFNEKLQACTTTQERADLIAKTLNDTYGESKQKYDELNQSVIDANEAELALKDTQAELGETMAPVNTAITNLKNQALEAIVPLVQSLANAFLNLLTWLREHPVAVQVLTAVVIALATAFTVLAGALAIQGIINGVTKAIAFLNTTLLANPIVLITALIAGLVAGFIYLWNTCDSFREFWINLWNTISSFFTKAWNTFINTVVKFATQLPGKMASLLSEVINRVVTWGTNLATKGKQAGQKLLDSVINKVKEIPAKIKSVGSDIVNGLWNGIQNKTSWLINKIKSFCNNALNSIKNFFGIKSPSRVMRDEVGRFISEGLAVGIEKNANKPIDALNTVGNDMLSDAELLNGATIERKLATTFNVGSTGLTSDINGVLSKLDGIYNRLNRLQIVLDTGTLVGETIDKIDAGLGNRQLLSYRGV